MESYEQPTINRNNEERSLKGISLTTAAILCYVGFWVSGIIFLVIEQKNRLIRFHALQSIFVFGILFLASSILTRVPVIGPFLSVCIGIATVVVWIILMVKASNKELFKMPWVGDLSERLACDSIREQSNARNETKTSDSQPENNSVKSETETGTDTPSGSAKPVDNPVVMPPYATPIVEERTATNREATGHSYSATSEEPEYPEKASERPFEKNARLAKSEAFRAKYYSAGSRTGRIVGSAFAIAWSIALLIFFNYFYKYIAYYEPLTGANGTAWHAATLVTPAFTDWLPILTLTLVLTIIGHAILIVYDKYIVREITEIALSIFGIVTIVTLLTLMPFDFSPIPNDNVVYGLQIGIPIALILLAVGIGIGTIVKFIVFLVHLVENKF
jgi:uncharacterized membrane protein